jgi:beta-glucosidase
MAEEADMWAKSQDASLSTDINFDMPIEELPLPANFAWGAATAAYQIEGAASKGGKGLSIWDTFTHLEPSKTNGENADVSCDHYHHVKEDVDMMSSLGMEVYRFSIAWARIIPLGGCDDPANEEGIAFYDGLINELLEKGIEPVATLYHWDVPQALYDRYGAFLDTQKFMVDFKRYANLCFSRFGDRVKKWVTFNEPYIISIFAYLNGTLAPGHCAALGTDTMNEPWRVGHTIILSHASVVQMYRDKFQNQQGGEISIVLNGHFYEPYDIAKKADRDAAEHRMEFYIGWFGDPIFLGQDYPASLRAYLGSRLPVFAPEERELLRRTASTNAFYGMNHYSTKYIRKLETTPAPDDWTGNTEESSVNSDGKEVGPASSLPWLRIAPEGFRKLLNWVWNRYHIPIIVTENGCPCPGETDVKIAINDEFRQRYFGVYLDAISRAIYEDGVKVVGYYAWSLMDNFGMIYFLRPLFLSV